MTETAYYIYQIKDPRTSPAKLFTSEKGQAFAPGSILPPPKTEGTERINRRRALRTE
jgi:hypothetical protein